MGLAVLAVAACAYTAFTAPLGGDYPGPPCRGCDFAAPPINALASGNLTRFFDSQPLMGPFTLVLRAPVVAVARALGGGQLLQYRLGALACLLLAAALAFLLISAVPQRRGRWLLQATVLALIFAGPLTVRALWWGHPEEIVGGMLCVSAVLLAGRGRPMLAGLTLGLAIATKQWAVLAILPALIACEHDRRRLVVVAFGVAALFIVPMFVGDPSLFLRQNLHAGQVRADGLTVVLPTDVWWGFAHLLPKGAGLVVLPALLGSIAAQAHAITVGVSVLLSAAFWRRRRGASTQDVLSLLALVLLVRCLLDPLTISYFHAPFFIALAASECLRRRGIPVLTLVTAAAMWVLSHWVAPAGSNALNEYYMLWALPTAGVLAFRCFVPGASLRRAVQVRLRPGPAGAGAASA